jgi:site-specific recombinase XerD
MRVHRVKQSTGRVSFELLDDANLPIPEVSGFLRYLESRDYSPHTISAYAYDLLHFSRFLAQEGLTYAEFRPAHALVLVAYLRAQPVRRPVQRTSLARCTTEQGQPTTCLSAPTVNRILAAISSLYEYLIVSEQLTMCGLNLSLALSEPEFGAACALCQNNLPICAPVGSSPK